MKERLLLEYLSAFQKHSLTLLLTLDIVEFETKPSSKTFPINVKKEFFFEL